MKPLFKHPLFILGLVLRLILLATVAPQAPAQWYIPFLQSALQHFSLDPWHTFLNSGGSSLAFPYGYVMLLAFLPLTITCQLLDFPIAWGYGLTLLAADIGICLALKRLITISNRKLLLVYWLSPIVLFATYCLGLNDIIPIFILCLALSFIRQLKAFEAGILCGAAISAKLSMILAAPLFCVYLFRNQSLRYLLGPFILGLSGSSFLFWMPFLLSQDALTMLLNNPEMAKVYDVAFRANELTSIYILPMAYLLTLYLAWYIRRISFDLFFVLLGIAFFLVLLLTPASPGWFLWVLPLLVFYQANNNHIAIAIVGVFTLFYVALSFLITPRPTILGSNIADVIAVNISAKLGMKNQGVLFTVLLTIGIILMIRIWRQTVRNNNFFRISRKPIVIGISGDSGSGKDTLVNSLVGLFGSHSVVTLSGDDYHLWDRQKPMWQVMTHLNPRANDLEQFTRDLITLADSKTILSRHYDHSSGRKSKPYYVKSNDFIVASGLHALYLPILRACYDLSIYLDIDEGLRKHFKLERDVNQRGHSLEKVLLSLEKRAADSQHFIRPQAAYADLVISLHPIHPDIIKGAGTKHPLRYKLFIRAKHGLHEESLVRTLVGICGLHVDMTLNGDNSQVELIIEGETSAEDMALAAKELLPELTEILDPQPKWQDGVLGIMQLIVLSHINQALNRRIL